MQAVIVVTVDVAQVLFTVVLILLIIIPVLQAMTYGEGGIGWNESER